MLSRILIGVASAAGAAVIGVPGTGWADPEPPPAPPNINSYALAMPSDYSVTNNAAYAFSTPDGLTCVLDRQSGGYGCSGPIPAAPNGANMVSGGPVGAPGFTNTDRPVFFLNTPAKPLPPLTRLSFRNISCGVDGGGVTTCLNSRDQTGFVLSPAGSFIVGEVPPLLDRPAGTRPF